MMINAAFFLILIIITAMGTIMFYKRAYARFINRKLREQSYNYDGGSRYILDSHNGALVIVGVVFFFCIGAMASNVRDIESEVDGYKSNAEREYKELRDIKNNLKEIKKINKRANKPQSMISRMDLKYGDMKADHRTAEATFYVTLKSVEKNAEYYLILGEEKQEVKLSENKVGVVEGTAELDIFKHYEYITLVKKIAEGNTVTEEIHPYYKWGKDFLEVMGFISDEYGDEIYCDYEDGEDDDPEEVCIYEEYSVEKSIYDHYLFDISEIDGNSSYKNNVLKYSAYLSIDNPEIKADDYRIESAKIAVVAGGKIVDEVTLDAEDLFTKEGYKFKYDNKIKGESVKLFYIVTDSYGYTYMECIWAEDDEDDDVYWITITDKDGNTVEEFED